MNLALRGRSYGPFTYEVGAEKIREFAAAIYGATPSRIYTTGAPGEMPRVYDDPTAAGGPVIAPPTFCVNFAIKPFVACTLDPEVGLNRLLLVHGEQEFEFFDPVRAGDVLTTTGTITELFEKSGKDFAVVETLTTNQHGRNVVRAVWTAVIRKS